MVEALESAGAFVSGRAIARELGISRAAVWKHVEALRASGYSIETARARGYRLLAKPDALAASAVRAHLGTRWLGGQLHCVSVTDSTNSDVAVLGRQGAEEGTVVIADAQRAGRGRLGRSWVSVPGLNLYLSILLRPAIIPAEAPQLSLVAGVAVAAALEGLGVKPRIKWPNDLLLEGRKVAGVLTEIEAEADRVRFVVVGIGVNLNSRLEHFPLELHDKATSVGLVTGRPIERAKFAAELLAEMERCYDGYRATGFAPIAAAWNRRAALTGRQIRVSGASGETAGVCAGIDGDGALLLDDQESGARQRILAGDVTVLGGYDS